MPNLSVERDKNSTCVRLDYRHQRDAKRSPVMPDRQERRFEMIQDMEKSNMDFIMDVFKTITGELPEMMLYREDGDGMELRSIDSLEGCMAMDLQSNGWDLVGGPVTQVA